MKKAALRLLKTASNAVFGPNLVRRSRVARAAMDLWTAVWAQVSPAQRRQRSWERANPDAPWLAPDSIPAISALLKPDFRVFEYGAGRSTVWFAKQVAEVVSVEARREWLQTVREKAAGAGVLSRITLIHAEVPMDHDVPPEIVRRYTNAIAAYPQGYFDLVLVDGHFRSETLAAAFRHVRRGGIVVLDNADQMGLELEVERWAPLRLAEYSNGIQITAIYRAAPA